MTNIYIEKLDGSGNTISVYTLTNSQLFAPDFSAPVSPMPLPQNDDTQNILIKIEGNSTQISQRWQMKLQTSNNADPTHSQSGYVCVTASDPSNTSINPLTPFDQIKFFKKFILPTTITDRYRFTIADSITLGSVTTVNGISVYASLSFGNPLYQELGTITGLKPSMTGDSPTTFDSSLVFMVGNVISAYETNTPTEPQNFVATKGAPASHSLVLTWTDPDDTAGGITGFKIYRNEWNGIPTLLTTITRGTHTYNDTATTSGKTYYYTIYATNSQGLGGPSLQISKDSP